MSRDDDDGAEYIDGDTPLVDDASALPPPPMPHGGGGGRLGGRTVESQWDGQHRKPGGSFIDRVHGFGPDGRHALFLPSAKVARRLKFVGGKPVAYDVPSVLDDAEIYALRDKVLRSVETRDNPYRLLTADVVLMEYAAALIRTNYNVADDDLTFLLCNSTDWIVGVAMHAAGGVDVIHAVARLNPTALREMTNGGEERMMGDDTQPPLDVDEPSPPPSDDSAGAT